MSDYTCNKNVDCYKNAIQASTFAGPLKLMTTMAQGWTADALFTLMVDVYGVKIRLDSLIFTDFMTNMDTWLSTDFVAETRKYIENVVTDQINGGNQYVTKIECQMNYSKYQSGGIFKYSPVIAEIDGFKQPSCYNTAAFTANGLDATQQAAIAASLSAPGYMPIELGSVPCMGKGGDPWNTPGYYCAWKPQLTITSKFVEVNRNDPLEEHGGDFYSTPEVDIINVFNEVNVAIMAAKMDPVHGMCLSIGEDGPPVVSTSKTCQDWFGALITQQKKNFAGLMGLYMYLKNPAFYGGNGSGLLSLKQIHQVFAAPTFLNNRLTLFGNSVCGAQVTGANYWLPPLVKSTNGLLVAQSAFTCSKMGPPSISAEQATEALAQSVVPYEADFKMFETIPSAANIQSAVFGSGYHSEWNPTGSRKFYASAVQNSGKPIFCKMLDKVTGVAKESQLDANTQITCLSNVSGLGTPDVNGVMNLPAGYPYVLQNYGYQGDTKGGVFALADAKTGIQVRPGNSGPVLIYQINPGNEAGQCDGGDQANDGKVVTAKLNFGWGDKTQSQATPVYCMDMTAFAQPSTYMYYFGGELEIKQVDANGNSWTWKAQQVGRRNPLDTQSKTLLPVCYFAPNSGSGLNVNANTGFAQGLDETQGALTPAGDDAVDVCSSNSYPTHTKYYLVMMGQGWQSATRSSLKAYLIQDKTGAQVLQYKNWDQNTTYWEDLLVSMNTDTIERAMNSGDACSELNAAICKSVTPIGATSPIMGVQLANRKWNAKFDPFCDDVNGNGHCDCYAQRTSTPKAPESCTLEDDSAEPTISNPPYYSGSPNADKYEAMFAAKGGKSGEELSTIVDQNGATVPFNGMYLNDNQLWMDMNSVFQCKYHSGSETAYRSPSWIMWDNFGSLHHGGCPESEGGTITQPNCSGGMDNCAGGGPVRMIKPLPAKNTYAIARPNSIIKLINYATKTVGQGITVNPDAQIFSFDEALAFVALRGLMPALNTPVYQAGTTEASEANVLAGSMAAFQEVFVPSLTQDKSKMDISSAVLRAITHPDELSSGSLKKK